MLVSFRGRIVGSQGRIRRANLPYERRKPIMLERMHKLAELIVLIVITEQSKT